MNEYTELEPLRKLIKKSKQSIFFVGGTVRDYLLNKKTKDIDIVTEEDPEELLKDVNFFPLDKERKIFRIVYKDYIIDVAKLQGNSIIKDLKRRDFTVNAIAYDIKQKKIMDPLNGSEDLRKGLLKAVSFENLKEDPIRILRAVRFWLFYPFRLEKKTKSYLSKAADHITKTAGERLKEELFKIMAHPISYKGIHLMYELKILDYIIPEFPKCRGLFQGKFLGVDLAEHLIYTYKSAEVLLKFVHYFWGDFENILSIINSATESNIEKKQILKFSALLHDIAKPKTFLIRNNEYTFWGHDKEGALIAEQVAERLKLSNKTKKSLASLVSNHMRLHLLARAGEITDKAKGRFFRQLGEDGVMTVLLSLADTLASSGEAGFYYIFPFAYELIEFYFNSYLKKEFYEKPILSGYEIMDILNIKPGPQVGKIIRMLLDAQAEGKVKTKEEAIRFIKEEMENGKG